MAMGSPSPYTSASGAQLDQPTGVTDGMSPRRARRHHGVVGSFEAVTNLHLTGQQIDQRRRNKERTYLTRAPFMQRYGGLGDGFESTDAGSHQHPGAAQGFFVLRPPSGIRDRLIGGSHAENDEFIDLALVLRRHHVVGIELPGLVPERDLAGNPASQIVGLEFCNRACAGVTGNETCPRFLDTVGQRCNET